MTDDMLSWLRGQIEHRLVAARATTKGGWEIGEPMPYSDPGSGISIVADGDEIAGPGHSGGGVWKQEDAAHIAFNDPRQIIADCEADLMILDEHEIAKVSTYEQAYAGENGQSYGCRLCHEHDGITVGWGICQTLRGLASRYRHRPGYRPEWAPEGTTP